MVNVDSNYLVMFSDFIRESTGINFTDSNWFGLKVSLCERMKANDIIDLDVYLARLKQDAVEREELIALLVVPETYFFRDKQQFQALTRQVLPEIILRKRGVQFTKPEIKIVSCGCSIGPESYSIAIAILQSGLLDQAEFDIAALDLDKKSITFAQEAVYSPHAFREPDTDITQYFTSKNNKFALNDSVKRMVKFHQKNLLELLDNDEILKGADIVFMRNVLIYFQDDDIIKALTIVGENLSSDGYLFLGRFESPLRRTTIFELEEIKGAVVWRLNGHASKKVKSGKRFVVTPPQLKEKLPRFKSASPVIKKVPVSAVRKNFRKSEKDESHYENALGYSMIKRLDKAEIEYKAQLEKVPNHLKSLIGLAQVYADTERDQLAIAMCEKSAQIDNLLADVYFIMGLVSYKNHDYDNAISHFKKIIYCDESHFVAQYYLALAYKETGRIHEANRQFSVAVHTIEDYGRKGLTQEISGHSGSYILSLSIDGIV